MSVVAESPRSTTDTRFPFVLLPKVPFTWVRPAAALFDGMLTIAASVVADLVYSRLVLGSVDNLAASFALGLVVTLYFIALNGYRRNYAADSLADVYRQLREVTAIWCIIFLLLAGVAFLLKIGESFSRGSVLTFFFVGCGLIISSRLFLARSLLFARAGGAFAEQEILIIADPQLLAATSCVDDLQRYGYHATKILYFRSARVGLRVDARGCRSDGPLSSDRMYLDYCQLGPD